MRRYDQRPCTSNSRSRYANRARAKSLARTACLPSWPLIPTPMWAAGHRHRHTMNTNGSTLGTLCPWTNYGDLSWLLDIRLTAFFTPDKIDKLAPEKYKPFWILRKEEMMGRHLIIQFLQARCPCWCATNSVKALKAKLDTDKTHKHTSHNHALICSVRKPAVDTHQPLRKAPVDAHARWESPHWMCTALCAQLRGVQQLRLASPAHSVGRFARRRLRCPYKARTSMWHTERQMLWIIIL